MEVCFEKFERNIESVLRRDAEDCEMKGLRGYLKDNLCLYTNTGIGDCEVACNTAGTVINEGRKILEKDDTFARKKNQKVSKGKEKKNGQNSKLIEFNLTKFDTFEKEIDLNELDNLHEYSTDNHIYNQENKKKILTTIKEKYYLPKISDRRSSSLRHCQILSTNSVDMEPLPRDGEWSGKTRSVVRNRQLCDDSKETSGTSLLGKGRNPSLQRGSNVLSTAIENNFKSQTAKEYLKDVDEIPDSSIFHLTDVEFEQQLEYPTTKHQVPVSHGCKLNFHAILTYPSGTEGRARSRTDPEPNRAIDKAMWPIIARFEESFPSKALPTPRGLTPRKTRQTYQKPVCLPVLLPNIPVKPVLRMQHRQDKFVGLKREMGEEGRMLPTTLTGLEKGGYSVMTPYMASVVWSIMEDESVDKSRG